MTTTDRTSAGNAPSPDHESTEADTAPAWEHPLEKRASTLAPIDDVIRRRWSPRAFRDDPVSAEKLDTILEAARWAPSCYNEQPWRFMVARSDRPDDFAKLLGCLNEANQGWARHAPVLMLSTARRRFTRNDRENRHALHDLGLAMGSLVLQATSLDLYVHQMAGILPDHARDVYDIPDDFAVVAAAAVGYLGNPEQIEDPDQRASETRERSRRPLDEIVFEGDWGSPASFVGTASTGSD